MVSVRLCDYDELWREGARGSKTLAARALYEALSRADIIQEEFSRCMEERESDLASNELREG